MPPLDADNPQVRVRRFEERADVPQHVRTHDEDEHKSRYLWAAGRVGGRVLDIACGTGYGSAILSRVCEVVGVDRDDSAVSIARERVPSSHFKLADTPPVPYGEDEFDHVVCFETIEHVQKDLEFVVELRRVLRPGGHLIISTPNRAVTSPNRSRPENPYHVREYLLPELRDLVQRGGFTEIGVHFQREERRRVPEYVASAVMARIPQLCMPGRWWDRLGHGSGDVREWSPEVTHPLIWVLDCR